VRFQNPATPNYPLGAALAILSATAPPLVLPAISVQQNGAVPAQTGGRHGCAASRGRPMRRGEQSRRRRTDADTNEQPF
jgi:hypothetical protein